MRFVTSVALISAYLLGAVADPSSTSGTATPALRGKQAQQHAITQAYVYPMQGYDLAARRAAPNPVDGVADDEVPPPPPKTQPKHHPHPPPKAGANGTEPKGHNTTHPVHDQPPKPKHPPKAGGTPAPLAPSPLAEGGNSTSTATNSTQAAPLEEQVPKAGSENATARGGGGGANATVAPVGAWYEIEKDKGLFPRNTVFKDHGHFTMTVRPGQEATRVQSKNYYTGGTFKFRVRSAAVASGIITSVYLASGGGRKSDTALGKQDEIDLEWKGNTPKMVQTNVFLTGVEDLLLVNLTTSSSKAQEDYAIEWDDQVVKFFVDEKQVREKKLDRPLKPMQLHMSVWTTTGGWPGLIQWAGKTDWDSAGGKSAAATAEFTVLALPDGVDKQKIKRTSDEEEQEADQQQLEQP